MKNIKRGKGPWPLDNQLATVQSWLLQRLAGSEDDREMSSVSRLLLDAVSGLDRGQRMISNWKANESALDALALNCDRFIEGEPLQYILGEVFFMGLQLKIDTRALIPRPETEELVRHVLERQEGNEPKQVADVGTGSGCIALAWKSMRQQDVVTGFDISETALCLAQENAGMLGFSDVKWQNLDVLKRPKLMRKAAGEVGWDIVLSNPPYIPESEKYRMENRVVQYEPAGALFVPDLDPLCFYQAISYGCIEAGWLAPRGWLGMECHRDYAGAVEILLSQQTGWKSIDLIEDLQGVPRMVVAQKA